MIRATLANSAHLTFSENLKENNAVSMEGKLLEKEGNLVELSMMMMTMILMITMTKITNLEMIMSIKKTILFMTTILILVMITKTLILSIFVFFSFEAGLGLLDSPLPCRSLC